MCRQGMDVKAPQVRGYPPLPVLAVRDGVFPIGGREARVLIGPVEHTVDDRWVAGVLAEQAPFKAQRAVARVVTVDIGAIMVDNDLAIDQVQPWPVGNEA